MTARTDLPTASQSELARRKRSLSLFPRTSSRVWAIILALAAIVAPFLMNQYFSLPFGFPWTQWATVVNLSLIASLGAVAFTMLLGYAHQVSVAHAAFMMIGAMTGAYFGTVLGLSFFVIIPLSAVTGAVVGFLVSLPARRFHGLYLMVATLGAHFVVLFIFAKFQTALFGANSIQYGPPTVSSTFPFLQEAEPRTDGVLTISGNFSWYWVILVIVVLGILFMSNVLRAREGRAFRAVGQHNEWAASIGINVARTKVIAFTISSAFVSVSGVLGAYYIGARAADSFPFEIVLTFAIMIVVGGLSSIQGAVFGAFFYYGAPVIIEWVIKISPLSKWDWLVTNKSQIELGLFGVAIIVILVIWPNGLVALWRWISDAIARGCSKLISRVRRARA